jgi:hypothetical protein
MKGKKYKNGKKGNKGKTNKEKISRRIRRKDWDYKQQ